MHSEMGPVWQNPIDRTVRTANLSVLVTVHSFSAQYNTEQFWYSPLLPRNIWLAFKGQRVATSLPHDVTIKRENKTKQKSWWAPKIC